MTTTYVGPASTAAQSVLLGPDEPVTQLQLYNAIAEINSRVTARLEAPEWLEWAALAAAVSLAIIAACVLWRMVASINRGRGEGR